MNEKPLGQCAGLLGSRRMLFLMLGLLLVILVSQPTVAGAATTLNVTDKSCKIFDEVEKSSNHTWSGACVGGFADGEGVHRFKACDGTQCIFLAEIAVTRRGIKTGMSVTFGGDSPADLSGVITVLFYDSKGESLESVESKNRVTPTLPAEPRGLTRYVAVTTGVVKAAQLPGIGSGLSLSEVLILWEAWHSNANYQPPSHYDGPPAESSRTVEWYKQRDEYRRSLDQRDAERSARRQAAREEREREAAAAQQQVAALQRAAGVTPSGPAITPSNASINTSSSFDTTLCPKEWDQYRKSMIDYHRYLDKPTMTADQAALSNASAHWKAHAKDLDVDSNKNWLRIFRTQNYPEAVAHYQKARRENYVPKMQSSAALGVNDLALRICIVEVALSRQR